MRLWVRPGVRINLPLGFSRAVESAPDTQKARCFASSLTLSPGNPIPGSADAVKKKRELFPGLRHVSEFVCVTTQYPRPGSGILTRFPFDMRAHPKKPRFQTEFSYLLGSTNPCPIAVHMEPFSTSVFKVLIWIFATTTKICTRGRFTPAHATGFYTTSTPSYSLQLQHLPWWSSIGDSLQRHPFSGLVHSAGELLHTP